MYWQFICNTIYLLAFVFQTSTIKLNRCVDSIFTLHSILFGIIQLDNVLCIISVYLFLWSFKLCTLYYFSLFDITQTMYFAFHPFRDHSDNVFCTISVYLRSSRQGTLYYFSLFEIIQTMYFVLFQSVWNHPDNVLCRVRPSRLLTLWAHTEALLHTVRRQTHVRHLLRDHDCRTHQHAHSHAQQLFPNRICTFVYSLNYMFVCLHTCLLPCLFLP